MSEQRKTVSVVFCDLVGSTALGESVDPERLRALLARYFERMKGIVERHGGTVEKFIGDAVMAVFGVPVVHEDDALRAVRAAVEMRDGMPELGLQGRIGVMTGEVVTGTEERLVTGDAVNVAARLEQAAAAGEVLIGLPTLKLVRAAVDVEMVEPLALKGKSDPVPAFRLLAVTDAPERRHDAPFVGRDREHALIREAWSRVTVEQCCALVTVVGEAGVGKSRLAAEVLATIDASVVRGRCLPYGDGITYWPVVEVLKQLDRLPSDQTAAAAIRSLLGESDAPTSGEEIAWAFRKTLEHAAAEHPLVVVFDDIQWGEETFRDLIEHVALLSTGAPILLLCMARPELVEHHPTWPVTLRLEPLSEADVDELMPESIPAALRAKIVRAAGGNPLFVGEMLAMTADRDPERGGDVFVPPTLQALLAARLDQLEPAERTVLEHGAVEGEIFHRGSVQALTPEEAHVTPRLASLVRKNVLRPDRPQFPGEDGFRFRHLLIRDAAYDALPKATRARLHQRFADWLEEHAANLVERDEMIGYHLEQAHHYGIELGSTDPVLAARAAERLRRAGRAARARRDAAATVNLLGRAAELLPEHARPPVLVDLAEALSESGELGRASDLLDEAVALARATGDFRAEWLGRIVLADVRSSLEPEGAADAIAREAEAAIAAGTGEADDEVLAHAWQLMAKAHDFAGNLSAYAQALDHAAAHARRAGDVTLESACVLWKAPYFIWGPGHVDEGLRFVREVLGPLGDVPGVQTFALHVNAHMRARLGDFEGALDDVIQYRHHVRDLGHEVEYALTAGCLWDVCLWSGDWERGEQALREGYEIFDRIGDRSRLASLAPLLGEAVFRQGRLDEAERLSEIAAELIPADDTYSTAQWLTLRAKVSAARGDLDDAQALARRAIGVAPADEALETAAEARLALAEALPMRSPEARALAAEALELYERRGNVVGAGRVRTFLDALPS